VLVSPIVVIPKGMFRVRAPAFVCRQISDFFTDFFSSHLMRLRFPTPMQFEALAMSLYDYFWFHNDSDLTCSRAISERPDQNILFLFLGLGRMIARRWIVSCRRRARFSKIKLLLLTNKPRNRRNSTLQILILTNPS
jgi:hypothetical protein